MPQVLSTQGAHNIDDVLLAMKLKAKVDKETASNLFKLLEKLYLKLGYVIDRAKSLFSDRKYVLLSRYFVDGVELMLPFKTMIRAAVSLKNDIPTLHSRVTATYMYYKSVELQGGPVFFCEFLKFCDAYSILEFYSPHTATDISRAALTFLPIQLGGFGFHDPVTEMRSGDRDSLAYASALACRVLKSKHTVVDDAKKVASRILDFYENTEVKKVPLSQVCMNPGSICAATPKSGSDVVYSAGAQKCKEMWNKHEWGLPENDEELFEQSLRALVNTGSHTAQTLKTVVAGTYPALYRDALDRYSGCTSALLDKKPRTEF